MHESIIIAGFVIEVAATAFVLWLIPRKNWALFCETVDCFPENVRRLAAWYKRRFLRAAGRPWALPAQFGIQNSEFRIKR